MKRRFPQIWQIWVEGREVVVGVDMACAVLGVRSVRLVVLVGVGGIGGCRR